jgi:hypothetical protein
MATATKSAPKNAASSLTVIQPVLMTATEELMKIAGDDDSLMDRKLSRRVRRAIRTLKKLTRAIGKRQERGS